MDETFTTFARNCKDGGRGVDYDDKNDKREGSSRGSIESRAH